MPSLFILTLGGSSTWSAWQKTYNGSSSVVNSTTQAKYLPKRLQNTYEIGPFVCPLTKIVGTVHLLACVYIFTKQEHMLTFYTQE